jgi:hypothetical protein
MYHSRHWHRNKRQSREVVKNLFEVEVSTFSLDGGTPGLSYVWNDKDG